MSNAAVHPPLPSYPQLPVNAMEQHPPDERTPSSEAEQAFAPDRAAAAAPPPAGAALVSRRAPWIAAVLSAFPGLGSIYNGSYARGVAFFLTVLGLMYLADNGSDVWSFGVAFVWLFNVIDAYREARLIRAGLAEDLGARRLRPATSAAEGLGLGVSLFVIGLLAFLQSTLGLDVDWIFGLWPVGMMLAGAWFMALGVRRLREARRPAAPFTAERPPTSWQPAPAAPPSSGLGDGPASDERRVDLD